MGDSKGDEEGEQAEGGRDGDLEERLPRGDGGLERGEWGMGDEHEQAADDRQRHDRHDPGTDRGGDRAVGKRRQTIGETVSRRSLGRCGGGVHRGEGSAVEAGEGSSRSPMKVQPSAPPTRHSSAKPSFR